jgi:hypothetical protein
LAVVAALDIADECHLMKTKLDDEESRRRSSKPFTARTRERRQRHYTRRRYERELLTIVNDESLASKERHEARFALAGLEAGIDGPPSKR